MINQLIIKGFKSFVDKSINFNQLNILTGLNSSGKSTVIQALHLLIGIRNIHNYSQCAS